MRAEVGQWSGGSPRVVCAEVHEVLRRAVEGLAIKRRLGGGRRREVSACSGGGGGGI